MLPRRPRSRPALLASILLLALGVPTGIAAQSGAFDHSSFDRLLAAHVDSAGMVDYLAFANDPAFDGYLAQLGTADLSTLDEGERLALWINAYNAWTIRLINAEGRPESIRDINKTFGFLSTGGAWRIRLAEVAGETWTLDEIEHDIIRERFDEPRIHFALVCAAMGCPPLRSEAFTGARLDAQLDDQGRRFLRDAPEKNRVDVADRTVYLSKIFDWFEEDFGGSDEAVGRYIARWFPAGPERDLLLSGDFDVDYTDYDWSLNTRR